MLRFSPPIFSVVIPNGSELPNFPQLYASYGFDGTL
jgi:hypothetical protein